MNAPSHGPAGPEIALKDATLARIDEAVSHYPVLRSAALPVLHLVQEDLGFIPPEAVVWIARRLELEPIHVQELVTFYPMFRQKPAGRRHIKVCRTLSCALMGAHRTCAEFEKQFNTRRGEVSPDGEVTIEYVECLASCGGAPVVMIDDDLHEKVDPARACELAVAIASDAASRRAASAGGRHA
jgi:NADH-quinone oxidoreductase subunit E